MASIRKQGEAFEIRECESSPAGPRQRALARFRHILTSDVLDRAAAKARRPFDREALVRRARRNGIPVAESHRDSGAQSLLGFLRRSGRLDPVLVGLLRDALNTMEAHGIPDHLEAVVDSLGQSEVSRGRALRGLLRTASRIARSRPILRAMPIETFPRFSSVDAPS